MDALRFGRALRAVRRKAGLRQADVGIRSGISKSTVSRIELGRVGRIPFATLRRVGSALEGEVELTFRWRGEAVDRLLDAAHAELVDAAAASLARLGWNVAIETTFSFDGDRGSIDILAWYPTARTALVIEVKSAVPDAQARIAALDRKTRLATRIARERGWDPAAVARLLVVGEGTTSRRRVALYSAMFGTAFPDRGRTIMRWLRRPDGPLSGLLFLRSGTALQPNSRAVGLGQRRAGPGA